MINFDSLTLKTFYEENFEYFQGAKIQKIQQPSKSELIFFLRSKGETKKLYINFNPLFYHICFMTEQTEKLRNIKIPKSALMFCMLLRKYIQNAKILRVEVPKYERIFEIYFEYFDELNEKSQLCLAIELMGKYSNVILYNYDTNVIIGCAHNVSSEKSRERELYGMLPYVYPVKQKKKNLLKTDFETFKSVIDIENPAQSISSKFYYLTVVLVQDCINLISVFNYEKIYEKLTGILNKFPKEPCISNDYSKYYIADFPDTFKCSNINEMIDKYFSYYQHQYSVEQLRGKIIKYINSQLNRLYSLKIKQEAQTKKLEEADEYKNKADIITANLYNIEHNKKAVELYDFEGKEITIELDENKTPIENASKYYSLYKKSKNAGEYALKMLEETNSEILYYEEIKYFCDNTDTIEDLNNLSEELFEEKENTNIETTQNIEAVEIEGFKIYAGKNKKQNDYILSKLSNAEDLWFHPLNAAGAHIIVKTNKMQIPDNVILLAAKITKEYSSQKNNSKTSIIYTKRKYVKKANKKQAFVTYKNETEIIV